MSTAAWVECAHPGCGCVKFLDYGKSDEVLAVMLRGLGWLLDGGIEGVRCPEHNQTIAGVR